MATGIVTIINGYTSACYATYTPTCNAKVLLNCYSVNGAAVWVGSSGANMYNIFSGMASGNSSFPNYTHTLWVGAGQTLTVGCVANSNCMITVLEEY